MNSVPTMRLARREAPTAKFSPAGAMLQARGWQQLSPTASFSAPKNVDSVVLIQSFIRRKLVYKRMSKFKQRAQVIKELALTENK